MLDKSWENQLHITQSQLNSSHLKLLQSQLKIDQSQLHLQANQAEITTDNSHSLYTVNEHIESEKTFNESVCLHPEPVKIKSSNFTIEEKRLLVISRLQASKTCEMMGVNPWTSIANDEFKNCDSPCISVIVTLFNYSQYIYECLSSVSKSNADIKNIELLVIDDCSTDNSVSIVEEYLQETEVPTCLIKKWFNTGLADARNVGLKIARSPYVFILDADNWIHPNCLAVLYNTIKYSSYAAVYGIISMFHNQTKEEINRISCEEWNVNQLVRKPYIDAMAMFNKYIVTKVGGYSTELIEYGWFGWEDYDLWLKLAQLNYSCKLVPEVLSSYRVHCTSMINTTNQYELNFAKYFYNKFADLILKHKQLDMFFGYSQTEIYSSKDVLLGSAR